MGTPTITLLEEKPSEVYECGMCKTRGKKNKFFWQSNLTDTEIFICRECAYREAYGTKKMRKAKKQRKLEEKESY